MTFLEVVYNSQYGFRKHHATTHAIHEFVDNTVWGGGAGWGVPNSVFNKKNRSYSWFDKWYIT